MGHSFNSLNQTPHKSVAATAIFTAILFVFASTICASRAKASGAVPVSAPTNLTAAISSSSPADAPEILGFQEWKTARIEEAKTNLERLTALDKSSDQAKVGERKTSSSKSQSKNSRSQSPKTRSDYRIQQAQINLEIAQELSLNDFHLLYVNQLKDRDAFIEVVKKLSAEELADLLMAYQKSSGGSHPTHDIRILDKSAPLAGKPL